jgi:hypothetical protein
MKAGITSNALKQKLDAISVSDIQLSRAENSKVPAKSVKAPLPIRYAEDGNPKVECIVAYEF